MTGSRIIAGYPFEDIYELTQLNPLRNEPGVYVIFCSRSRRHFVIDVDESNKVKLSVEHHPRTDAWLKRCDGDIRIAVHYTADMLMIDRKRIVNTIREKHHMSIAADHIGDDLFSATKQESGS